MAEYDFNLGLAATPEIGGDNEDLNTAKVYAELTRVYNAVNILADQIQIILTRLAAAGIP